MSIGKLPFVLPYKYGHNNEENHQLKFSLKGKGCDKKVSIISLMELKVALYKVCLEWLERQYIQCTPTDIVDFLDLLLYIYKTVLKAGTTSNSNLVIRDTYLHYIYKVVYYL